MGILYVVDDDADIRQSITWTLNAVGYEVEAFSAAEDFLEAEIGPTPSVALIDLLLPGMTGLSLCREIALRKLPCTFIIISGHADVSSAVEAMRLGAIDLLEKPFGYQRLLDAANRALAISHGNHVRNADEEEALRKLAELSPREEIVLEAVSSGLATKEIASRLGISSRTVDVHRSRIMRKLRIDSPSQLAGILAVVKKRTSGDVLHSQMPLPTQERRT